MIHKGDQLEKQAQDLERKANSELDAKRREEMRRLAADLRRQKRDWYKPR